MQANKYYILDKDNNPVLSNRLEWSEYIKDNVGIVERTDIGGNMVTTRFSGLNYKLYYDTEPHIFQTDVYGPDDEGYDLTFSSTWQGAEETHRQMVSQLIEQLKIEV
jgi:hypothetical protein